MNALRLAWVHFRVIAMCELQCRVNLIVQVFHSALSVATGLIAIGLVFTYTSDLRGLTQPELIIVMGVHVAVGGFVRAFVFPNMEALMREIAEGEFDFALVRPVDSQLLVSIRRIRVWSTVDILVGLIVVSWGVGELGGVNVASVGAFVAAAICGLIVVYCLWLMITTSAFKAVRVEEITGLMNGIFDAARWPVSIYPSWLSGALTYGFPLAIAVTVPAEALTGRLTGAGLAVAVAVTLAMVIVTRLVWNIGVKSYSGASA
jgi:ABC-2 type transport system permease protein